MSLKRAILAALLCCFCAVPSLICGGFEHGMAGMLAGIAFFAVGYAMVAGHPSTWSILSRPRVLRALKATIGLRLFVVIIFPIGVVLDGYVGLISIHLAENVFRQTQNELTTTFCTTVMQGVMLHIILFGIFMLIYKMSPRTIEDERSRGRAFEVIQAKENLTS